MYMPFCCELGGFARYSQAIGARCPVRIAEGAVGRSAAAKEIDGGIIGFGILEAAR